MKLQIYILTRLAAGVGAALAVILAVIMLVDLVELARTVGGRGDVAFDDLLGLTLLKTPSIALLLAPFAFLFGSMGAFVTLNRRSELTAMRAAGVSAWRFLLPSALAAFLFGIMVVTALNPAAAFLNARFEERRAWIAAGGGPATTPDIWLRQGAPEGQIVIHAKRRDTDNGDVTLKTVSIFIQTVSQTGDVDFTRRIDAAQAVLAPGYWRLSDVREARPGSESVRSDTLALPTTLDRRSAMERFVAPGAVAFWNFPATVRAAERAGFSSAAYRLRYQQLLATPLLFAAMTLLAAAFSLRLLRLGDVARVAAAGIGLGFLVFFLGQVCGAFGTTEVIPVPLAAWTPPLLALLGAVTLLCHTEDG